VVDARRRRFVFFGPVSFGLGLLPLQVTVFDVDWHMLLLNERLTRTPPMLPPRRREQAHRCHAAEQNVVISRLDCGAAHGCAAYGALLDCEGRLLTLEAITCESGAQTPVVREEAARLTCD
jgi:hypothetical protein